MFSRKKLPVFYLHIGLPKTGTTFLQGMLSTHRATLAERGLNYPHDDAPDHFFSALDLRGDHSFGDSGRPGAAGRWPKFVDRARGTKGVTLFSHEVAAQAVPATLKKNMELLAETEVHVVLTVRDPARQIVAEWQESIKHARHRPFGKYVADARLDDIDAAPEPSTIFWSQRIDSVLDVWREVVPPERTHVVTVPRDSHDPMLLWDRFCSVLGVDGSGLTPSVDVAPNVSLGVDQVEALRRVNSALKGSLRQPGYGAVVKRIYAAKCLPKAGPQRKLVLPRRMHPVADALADRWITYLRDGGYQVVGDLEDLRPVHGEGDAPNDWTDENVGAVLTEATALLLLEMAELRK